MKAPTNKHPKNITGDFDTSGKKPVKHDNTDIVITNVSEENAAAAKKAAERFIASLDDMPNEDNPSGPFIN